MAGPRGVSHWTRRPDISFRGYLILYRVESDIEIDRVIHGAGDLDAALAEEL